MQLIPSLDLLDGRLVRLRRGDIHQAVFYERPPESWVDDLCAAGARRIHVVDLDGALRAASSGKTFRFVSGLPQRHPQVRFQFGGGLRQSADVKRVLDVGLDAVIGTLAVEKPTALVGLAPETIIVALDLAEGRVVTRGWARRARRSNQEIFAALLSMSFRRAVVTDIARDGMLCGPGLDAAVRVASAGFQVQVSGGLRSIADLAVLRSTPAVVGAIVGRALLEEHLRLDDADVRLALGGN